MNLLKILFPALLLPAAASASPVAADTVPLSVTERHEGGKARKGGTLDFAFVMQLPAVGALRDTVGRWAWAQFGAAGHGVPTDPSAPDGDRAEQAAGAYMEWGRADIARQAKGARRGGQARRPSYAFDFSVRRAYETDGIITFVAEAYDYAGEACARQRRAYATFRKSDGHRLAWDDIVQARQRPAFCSLVAGGLQDYFGVVGFDALRDHLTIAGQYGRTSLPLPAGGPGLVADGIRVQYEAGEIAPAEAGQPLAIVPYADMRRIWTKSAPNLLKR